MALLSAPLLAMAMIMMRIDEGDGYDDNDLCEMTIILLRIINYVQNLWVFGTKQV